MCDTRTYGLLIIAFWIFFMTMNIVGPPWLQFTVMNLIIASHFFMNSAACFCLPTLNTLYSSKVVVTLKFAFQVEFYCWKRIPFGLAPPSTLGFSSFIIGLSWMLWPTRRLLSRVIIPLVFIILIITPIRNPIDPQKLGTRGDHV